MFFVHIKILELTCVNKKCIMKQNSKKVMHFLDINNSFFCRKPIGIYNLILSINFFSLLNVGQHGVPKV